MNRVLLSVLAAACAWGAIAIAPAAVDARAHPSTYAAGVARDAHGRIARSREAVRAFERATGHPGGWAGHRVDHSISLACGGPDTPSNMNWLTVDQWKAKSLWERKQLGCPGYPR